MHCHDSAPGRVKLVCVQCAFFLFSSNISTKKKKKKKKKLAKSLNLYPKRRICTFSSANLNDINVHYSIFVSLFLLFMRQATSIDYFDAYYRLLKASLGAKYEHPGPSPLYDMDIFDDEAKCRAKKRKRFEEESRICPNPRIANRIP